MKKRKLKAYMRSIAALYGCKVKFVKPGGGLANLDGSIIVGMGKSKKQAISTFCHELAHHCNQIDAIYPRYHRTYNKSNSWFNRKKLEKSAKYAYRAEAYTEKRGRKICKTWFPKVKYQSFYDGDEYSKGFLYGYYYR